MKQVFTLAYCLLLLAVMGLVAFITFLICIGAFTPTQ